MKIVENILTDAIARNVIRWSDVKNKCLTRNQLFYSNSIEFSQSVKILGPCIKYTFFGWNFQTVLKKI